LRKELRLHRRSPNVMMGVACMDVAVSAMMGPGGSGRSRSGNRRGENSQRDKRALERREHKHQRSILRRHPPFPAGLVRAGIHLPVKNSDVTRTRRYAALRKRFQGISAQIPWPKEINPAALQS
jgi:hypothetical protein